LTFGGRHRGQQCTTGDKQLPGDKHQREAEHQLPLRDQCERIYQHADGDEKQRREDVTDWDDIGKHLLFEICLGNDYPGQERPETE
jgi:hypothetical protein